MRRFAPSRPAPPGSQAPTCALLEKPAEHGDERAIGLEHELVDTGIPEKPGPGLVMAGRRLRVAGSQARVMRVDEPDDPRFRILHLQPPHVGKLSIDGIEQGDGDEVHVGMKHPESLAGG